MSLAAITIKSGHFGGSVDWMGEEEDLVVRKQTDVLTFRKNSIGSFAAHVGRPWDVLRSALSGYPTFLPPLKAKLFNVSHL